MIAEWRKEDNIAVVIMNNGENRHNPAFTRVILDVLTTIEEDESIQAVVITSSDAKSWSQGIDLPWVMNARANGEFQAIKDFLCSINTVFKKILLFPMPVIAAINGHAAGNGAILACCCDFRFMSADRGYFFIPGVDISIPYPLGILAILENAVPHGMLEEMVLTGKRYTAGELVAQHVIVQVCQNAGEVLQQSLDFARGFRKKRPIFGEMKRRLHQHIITAMDDEDTADIEKLDIFRL